MVFGLEATSGRSRRGKGCVGFGRTYWGSVRNVLLLKWYKLMQVYLLETVQGISLDPRHGRC